MTTNGGNIGALQWTSRDDYKFRIKRVTTDVSTVWISNSGANLCIPLMMHDFIDHCFEVLNLHVEIDSSWKGQKGFKIRTKDIDNFLDETIKYINEWDIEPSENVNKIPEEVWFSDEEQ